jgi:hypothetical protein
MALRSGTEENRRTPEANPHSFSIMDEPSEARFRLSGKALVNSTLLSFDEPSIGPATNSRIDF